jgi:hypothetical protein
VQRDRLKAGAAPRVLRPLADRDRIKWLAVSARKDVAASARAVLVLDEVVA